MSSSPPRQTKWPLALFISIIIALVCSCAPASNPDNNPPVNHPPVITSLTANPTVVDIAGTSVITCIASDKDGDELTYTWTASAGDISGKGNTINWTAPDTPGEYHIAVKVTDTQGGEATTAPLTITVSANHPPIIDSLTANPAKVSPNRTSVITCIASDEDGDELTYQWKATDSYGNPRGSPLPPDDIVEWTAPNQPGENFTITVTVSDGIHEVSREINVCTCA